MALEVELHNFKMAFLKFFSIVECMILYNRAIGLSIAASTFSEHLSNN